MCGEIVLLALRVTNDSGHAADMIHSTEPVSRATGVSVAHAHAPIHSVQLTDTIMPRPYVTSTER